MTLLEEVLPYAEAGMRPTAIASTIDRSPSSVRSTMAILRRRGIEIPRYGPAPKMTAAPKPDARYAHPFAWSEILREVAELHKVSVREILSEDKTWRVVTARHDAMRRMRNDAGMSFSSISRRMKRDRSTVHFVCRKGAS